MWQDFKSFLLKENALALAIAVVIGAALNKVVTAIVDDFIMPVVGAVTPSGDWQKATLDVPLSGDRIIHFGIGDFLSVALNFIIIGFVVWRLSKLIPSAPKPATKSCPFCFNSVDQRATRCSHCTATL